MTNFVTRISLDNFNSVMTLFFRNIGYIDSTTELDIKDTIVDHERGTVDMEAEVTSESIQ